MFKCPKLLQNSPCEEVHLDGGCGPDPRHTCVFVNPENLLANFAFENSKYRYIPPMDWSGVSFEGRDKPKPAAEAIDLLLTTSRPPAAQRPARSDGEFERRLRSGQFAITCEVDPAPDTDGIRLVQATAPLRGRVDAVHVTDNARARLQMSGIIGCYLLERSGFETILHMTCRDRNRSQLQSDVLGAAGIGVKNIVCSTGAHPVHGDNPEVKPVYDLDQVSLIYTVNHLREHGKFLSGRALDDAPRVFLGGTIAPAAPPHDYAAHDMGKKVAAGADFVMTVPMFDMKRLRKFLDAIISLGLDQHVFVLVSLAIVTSLETANWINRYMIGVAVPDEVFKRLEATQADQRRREGLRVAVEMLHELRQMPAVAGVNFVPGLTDVSLGDVAEVCEAAGLSQRAAPAPLAAETAKAGAQ